MSAAISHAPTWQVGCDRKDCPTITFVTGMTLEDALAKVVRCGWTVDGGEVLCRAHAPTVDGAA
jgi:hypothetical protein